MSIPSGARSRRRGLVVLAAFAALGLAGCVERVLLIRTDPPGARVWVNGKDRGTSPVSVRYVHEGRFEVRIEKAGYESLADEVTTEVHLDAVPGPDFFAENGPWKIERRTAADFRLVPLRATPLTPDEMLALKQRAEAFRERARAAAVEPGTPTSTKPPANPAPSNR